MGIATPMKSLNVASGFKETETEMTDQLLLPPCPYAITPPCPSMLLYQLLKTPIQKSAAHLYTHVNAPWALPRPYVGSSAHPADAGVATSSCSPEQAGLGHASSTLRRSARARC